MIEKYLVDLENRIDLDVEEQLMSDWKKFLDGKIDSGYFVASRNKTSPPSVDWPNISINETLDDPEKMALQQLTACSDVLENDVGAILNVRTNYGTGILSSVFGAEVFQMDEEFKALPTTIPLEGGTDGIRKLLEKGFPELTAGLGGKCFETGNYFVELFRDYPKVSKYVHIYHPDLQGPIDIAELLWGSEMFLGLLDEPDLAHSLLELITETYTRFMHRWEDIVLYDNGYSPHWGLLHKGRIMLRDDSAMNLSPEMFDEFIKPYDQKLLTEFKGGGIHFCGRGDHYIESLSEMTDIYAVNMSQPEYNDMECIFKNTVDKGIALLGLYRDTAENAESNGRNLHGMVHCW